MLNFLLSYLNIIELMFLDSSDDCITWMWPFPWVKITMKVVRALYGVMNEVDAQRERAEQGK